MPLSGDECVCAQFQPNIFDSSRCHDCLRLKHLHTHTPTHTPEQVNPVSESGSRDQKEQSSKFKSVAPPLRCTWPAQEDSDDLSVVSGGSVCILSPECDLYVCDEDEHTFNSQCESDSSSSVCSFTPEEEEDFFSLHHSRMTRLDPPSHRNNPRMWMEETRTRDTFARRSSVPHGSSKGDRESGYFSLGRVAGARTLSDKSPSPHRHAERGHPLPSNRIPEPKAAIPFRNPDLGVPSHRRTSEIQYPDLTPVPLNNSSELVDLSIEVEAQAGPRSLSPTPFKQAESLSGSQKRGFSAQNSSSFFPLKKDSGCSRSSPLSQSSSPLKRTESVSSLSSRGYGMDSVSERQPHQSKSPNRNSFGRPIESETTRKNFRTFASTVGAATNLTKTQSRPYADLRAGLTKTEPTSGLRSLSPPKRSHDATSQILLRKTETKNFSSSQKKNESRNSSPSRSGSQSVLRKVVEGWRSASPVRKGYGTASQPERSLVSNGRRHSSTSSSPSRRNFASLHKSETKRHTSPTRRSYDAPTKQLLMHKSVSERSSYGRSPSPSKRGYDPAGQTLYHKSVSSDYSRSNRSSGSRSPSPSKGSYDQSLFRSEHTNCSKSERGQTFSEPRIESSSFMAKSTDSSRAGSWRGSALSLHSPSTSRNSSPSRKCSNSKVIGFQKPAQVSWSTGERRQSRDKHSPSYRNRSPSPLMRNHTSSQSSIDSVISSGSSGLNREEYAVMADLPKVNRVLQRAKPNPMERMERGSRDEMSSYKPASHSHTKPAHITWDDMTDQHGNPSPTHTPSQTQGNKMEQEKREKIQQPDLLNFKKGWMSKLDESGEWKKHWFVLTDAGLKYYRDSGAEEKDELDGEIDLRSCLKVSEFDVVKNYGFQIQTVSDVFTLSAMTAGIRRNWIEVLRKNIRPSSTPDITQLPESTTDKEDSRSQPSRRQSESASSPAHTRFDYVELSPVATPTLQAPANQREAGEGQVREHGQGQEDRRRNVQRETVTSRKWPGKTAEQRRLEDEIERKWEELERLPLQPTVALSALGSLQREVASLTQQAECVRGEGVVCVQGCVCEGGVCVCCSVGVEQMERAHRHALEELQKKHQRQIAEMEREKERLLNEETQATARAMEALKKAHQAQLEREVQKANQLTTQTAGVHTVQDQQQQELLSLRRELDGLSDRYSQKCLELNREQQMNGEKERQISVKEREMEELRRQNQDLQSRLTEEIQHIRSFVTGQRSDEVILNSVKGKSVCELEVLLRVKHSEVEYFHKEITCLRNEVQFLNTEKQSVCVQYQDACEELKVLKERSEREVQTLREHLRLAAAALQEERGLHNSI